jgi:uncharacterized protein (DUF1499 family)
MRARWIGWLVGAGVGTFAVWAARQPLVNDVTTGRTPEYPGLQPRRYPQDPSTVFRAIQAVAGTRPGWRITMADPVKGLLHAEAHVQLTPFTDDVTLWVEPLDSGSQVRMRSHSRVGRADLGVNARRIRAFLSALDHELRIRHRDTETQRGTGEK